MKSYSTPVKRKKISKSKIVTDVKTIAKRNSISIYLHNKYLGTNLFGSEKKIKEHYRKRNVCLKFVTILSSKF